MNIHKKVEGIILAVSACVLLTACSCGFGAMEPNEEYANLDSYFGIEAVGSHAGAAIIVDGLNVGNGLINGGSYYIPYESVRGYVDDRYYWDSDNKLLSYVSSRHVYDAAMGENEYTADEEKKTYEKPIVLEVEDEAYIELGYLLLMNGAIDVKTYEEPDRVVFNIAPAVTVAEISEDTELRTAGAITNPIVADLKKGAQVQTVSENNGWTIVETENGLIGSVKTDKLSASTAKERSFAESWLDTEPYTYISRDYTICLGWHQMEYEAGNDSLNSMISGADSLNVISPTWFKVNDEYGGISSLASKSYVDKAHDKGLEVWGLISDFNTDENGNYYINSVVTNTYTRRELIDNLVKEASECGMDGINVDFEMIRLVAAEGYVQFMRELAIRCDELGLVLSVDMYVPTGSNAYYDRESIGEVADYLIIMGYDEHWAGCGQAGSVASLPFVTQGILDTLKEVPSSRVINAVPFYTRVWYEDSLENAPEGSIVVEDAINGDYALSSKAVGLGAAKELLEDNGASLRWLEDIGQYYGEYYIEDRLARIWLEDKKSLTEKLNVMKANNLAGVACWKLGLESEEAWEAIGEYMQ